ncbi:hypothetical protein [Antribacter gilvus]|uniref:hypothetical protein n=1 Tax=Antribacter gilvus TaxID=2304675 RepID=UPI000F7984E4|nr:hypothetical protein [Antribacter gilvus]
MPSPGNAYTFDVGGDQYVIPEEGWAAAAMPMLIRIAWLVPDDDPQAPYLLDDASVDDLREAMTRVLASGTDPRDHDGLMKVLSYEKTGTTTSSFDRDKVRVGLDALIEAGMLAEGPQRFGLRSVVLRVGA